MVMARRLLLLVLLALGTAGLPAAAGLSADPSGPTVTVSLPGALTDAYLVLSAQAGGGTIALAADFPAAGEIALSGGGAGPVHVTSADPANRVPVSRIVLDGIDNLRISNVHVDSTGASRPEAQRDMDIVNSSRIEIIGVVFTSNGSLVFDPTDAGAVLGERLSMVRHSRDITVTGCYIAGHEQGLTFQESTGITVTGNEITAIQGDGIRLAGVIDVLIANNYMHDFSATPNEFTHSDFIQMWSRNAEIVSRDVTITGNVLDTGNGVAAQGIWIGNPEYSRGNTGYVYRNLTIADNLIYTGAANGIGVGAADGVVIADNTLLWNQAAVTIKADGNTSFFPRIRLDDAVVNARVRGNITTRILHGPGASLDGNVLLSWTPGDPAYAGAHFANVASGGDIGPNGWRLRPSSPWVGIGARASQP
ncbi:hypothetical protein HKCCE3408_17075 [Rhodobacterales bacterium HKCCE3408]|nr:hypothetical protein [Rhodobacterales bacterium HKCCE3408]